MMSSLLGKRNLTVSEINEEAKGVSIHGIPQLVSPVKGKEESRYFHAKLNDGKKARRVVSFDVAHQPSMKKAEEEKSVVVLENSNVKMNTVTRQLEVHLNKQSVVMSSPRKFELSDSAVPNAIRAVKIADIAEIAVNEMVEVVCKVSNVKDVETVKKRGGDKKELVKQDVLIGDETKSCRLVFWEKDVNLVEEGKCYRFTSLGVRQFLGIKYLSFTSDSTKELVEEQVEKVNEECFGDEDEEEESGRCVKGEIVSVVSVSEYHSCKFCRSKAIIEDSIAECTKCGAVMKASMCEEMKAAKIVVDDGSGYLTTLSVFEPILTRIVKNADVGSTLSRKLMNAPKMAYRFNDKSVIFSVREITC